MADLQFHTDYGPNDFEAEFGVSRETMAALDRYDQVMLETQAHTNLIARSTIDHRWARHYRDSAQLFTLLPEGARSIVDLGSGAGFPGLILAAMGLGSRDPNRGIKVTLVESIQKKASFLTKALSNMGLENVSVVTQRIEKSRLSSPDVITARALARLDKLLGYAAPIAAPSTLCIFPKGQDVEDELTEATKSWHMGVKQVPSVTNPQSSILLIEGLKRKT
ncbi:MAG: 16S rRNA (guanine(527)-N(7))-methyltransferase RsmG [Pseudomonadota bacterium]